MRKSIRFAISLAATQTRDVCIRKVKKVNGQLWNVEFDVQKAVEDPGKPK